MPTCTTKEVKAQMNENNFFFFKSLKYFFIFTMDNNKCR